MFFGRTFFRLKIFSAKNFSAEKFFGRKIRRPYRRRRKQLGGPRSVRRTSTYRPYPTPKRTPLLVPADSKDITNEYNILLNELNKYSPDLLNKEKILAISKSDMLDLELKKEIKKDLPKNISTLFISSVAQSGIRELKDLIWNKLNE